MKLLDDGIHYTANIPAATRIAEASRWLAHQMSIVTRWVDLQQVVQPKSQSCIQRISGITTLHQRQLVQPRQLTCDRGKGQNLVDGYWMSAFGLR